VKAEGTLNPVKEVCFICGYRMGVQFLGPLPTGSKLPQAVASDSPCAKCEGFMKEGVVLVSIMDGDTSHRTRTGAIAVLTERSIRSLFSHYLTKKLIRDRFGFVEDSVWDALKLPRGILGNSQEKAEA
jgi:hypothetical protein